jgi:hypothetical protein
MADASDRRSLGRDPFQPPFITPASWGKNDAGEPFSETTGNTPGPAGTGGDRAQQIALDAGPVALDGGVPDIPDAGAPNIPDAGLPKPMSADAGTQADDNAAAKKKVLISAQDDVMSDDSLAPDVEEKVDDKGKTTKKITATHCSEATFRVAKATGVPWDGILGTDKAGNKNANDMIAGLEQAAKDGSYKVVTPDQAQQLANNGVTVFATQANPGKDKNGNPKHGHLATVRPEGIATDRPSSPYKKPLLANVGATVGVSGYLAVTAVKGVKGGLYGIFFDDKDHQPVVFYTPK